MTLPDDRSGFNQMLLDPCFCMRLQNDTACCEGGGGFNQMLLELCFSVTLQDERGEAVPRKSSCSLAFVCRTTTLYDERQKVSEP